MTDSLTLYKLIVLYMLDKVDFPLNNSQISEFILDKEYTTYFNLQQAISELIEADFIHMETFSHSSLYTITDEGRNTLSYFGNKISDAIKEEINVFFKDHSYVLRNEVSIRADYYKTPNGDYAAHCMVKEKESTLFELTLNFPLQEQAASACVKWKEKNQEIYAYLMAKLL